MISDPAFPEMPPALVIASRRVTVPEAWIVVGFLTAPTIVIGRL
jgi:hypothetical protein